MVVGPVTGRKYKRSTIRNAMIIGGGIVALLVLVFGGKFTVQNISEKAEQKTQSVLQGISIQAADRVAAPILAIKKILHGLAQDEDLVALLTEADGAALESWGEQKQSEIESALKLRLLFPGKYETDREAKPPLSFASIDLLRRAEKSVSSVAAEVHSLGGDGAHIAFVSPVTDADNNLIGLLHLSMRLGVVESVTSTFDVAEAYIEIQQGKGAKALTLTRFGDAKLRSGNPVVVGIEGTKWNAASWNRSSTATLAEISESVDESSGMGLIVFILLILVAAAAGFVFYRHKLTDTGSKEVILIHNQRSTKTKLC